jgi:hypothetical protein
MTPLPNNNVEYIDSGDYKTLSDRLESLKEILDDNVAKLYEMRVLRFAEVDIEAERLKGRIQPDELYVPQHLIDTNIRQEQSPYVQYVTESPRAVICTDKFDKAFDLALLEQDLTEKLRYDGWQLSMYSNIDGFQMNGYSIMESVLDDTKPGQIAREVVSYGDFAFINDTKNLQNIEMCGRSYYYTKTQLKNLATLKQGQKPEDVWDATQVKMLMDMEPSSTNISPSELAENVDRSLYRVQKVMFRIRGVVHVGWTCIGFNDDWLRSPRPLFMGRRQIMQPTTPMEAMASKGRQMMGLPPKSQPQFETQYPYFLYPYLISENDTIAQLKGRVYLDQDTQEAVSSLLSSTVTQARRAAGSYFSKENSDPNDDVLVQKNVYFEQNCLINANVKQFKIDAPDPGIFSAIQSLMVGKQAETSQVAFAVQNRKDSRKTKKELDLAEQTQSQLSTIQVVLFSLALKSQFTYETSIITSRVKAGLIKVNQQVRPLYDRDFTVKPSGDIDVIERQKLIGMMLQFWEIIATTAAGPLFLADMLEKMFPNSAAKYVQALQQAAQQAQSGQAQQMQQVMSQVMQMAQGIIKLSKEPQFFSDEGRLHAFPVIKAAAEQLEQMLQQQKQAAKQQPTAQPQLQ